MKFPLGPRVTVDVTRESITKAVRANSSKCWIAESIKAQVPDATSVIVDLATTRFSELRKGLRYVYLTPYSAQLALLTFDEGMVPEPFKFVLKNAHVTRAGEAAAAKDKRQQTTAAKAVNKALTVTRLASSSPDGVHAVPRRIGGKRPPQLRMMRQFGVRAFRGADAKRQAAVATTPTPTPTESET